MWLFINLCEPEMLPKMCLRMSHQGRVLMDPLDNEEDMQTLLAALDRKSHWRMLHFFKSAFWNEDPSVVVTLRKLERYDLRLPLLLYASVGLTRWSNCIHEAQDSSHFKKPGLHSFARNKSMAWGATFSLGSSHWFVELRSRNHGESQLDQLLDRKDVFT